MQYLDSLEPNTSIAPCLTREGQASSKLSKISGLPNTRKPGLLKASKDIRPPLLCHTPPKASGPRHSAHVPHVQAQCRTRPRRLLLYSMCTGPRPMYATCTGGTSEPVASHSGSKTSQPSSTRPRCSTSAARWLSMSTTRACTFSSCKPAGAPASRHCRPTRTPHSTRLRRSRPACRPKVRSCVRSDGAQQQACLQPA